jgi:hypothetical protein
MFCSWLHRWLGMTRYTWSNALLLQCCRCEGHSQSLLWVVWHKHGHSAWHLRRKKEGSDPFFYGLKVYQVAKCIEGCHCGMGTVSDCDILFAKRSRGSRMVAQALRWRKEPDAQPRPFLMQKGLSPWHGPAEQTGDYSCSGTSTAS